MLLRPLLALLLLLLLGPLPACTPSSLPPAVSLASLAATPLLAAYERAPLGPEAEARWEAVWAAYRELRAATVAWNVAAEAGVRPSSEAVTAALCRLAAAVAVALPTGEGAGAGDVAPFLAAVQPLCGAAAAAGGVR
jgi:hypothetical protein